MGRAIYVSSVNGDDANSGYAPEKAFRSLRKVNQMEIQPGDQILLERCGTFDSGRQPEKKKTRRIDKQTERKAKKGR